MQVLFTPKQVAKAIGVSESSLKRWCDRGLIKMEKTVGGHRRLPVREVLRFLRENGHTLVDPEILGLPSISGRGERVIERSRARFREALLMGKEELARRVLYDLYLSKIPISEIVDQVFAGAFEQIGLEWECGQVDIFEERRGCQIAQKLLFELSAYLPVCLPDSPIAVGASGPGDQYTLPTTCVELVLRDLGWQATSLGSNIPFASLELALTRTKPKLFWLSVSHIEDEDEFRKGINFLYEIAQSCDMSLLIGGRAVTLELRKLLKYTCFAESMQHLEAFARTQHHFPAQRKNEFESDLIIHPN